MNASIGYSIGVIAICVAITFLERLLPFLIFRKGEVPSIIRYLGRILPMAVMAALVVYCLKSVSFTSLEGWIPSLAGVAVTAGLHLWKGNTLLSVVGGTACYMLLLQLVF